MGMALLRAVRAPYGEGSGWFLCSTCPLGVPWTQSHTCRVWYSPWEGSDCLFLEVMKSRSRSASSVCSLMVCAFVCPSPAFKSFPLNQVGLLLQWGFPVLKRMNASDLTVISKLFPISFLENLTLLSPRLWHSFSDLLSISLPKAEPNSPCRVSNNFFGQCSALNSQ